MYLFDHQPQVSQTCYLFFKEPSYSALIIPVLIAWV